MARGPGKRETVRKALKDSATADSTPDDVSAPPATTAGPRHVSVKEAAGLLDRDRNTISKWLDQGCPFVQRADRDLGRAWVLDLAEVVRWLEQRAADSTAEKLGASTEGMITKDEAERRTAIAKMVMAEKAAAEDIATVVPVSVVIDRIAKDYNELRGRLMSIPDAIAGQVNASVSAKVREVADDSVRRALASLKARKKFGDGEE